jgi:hypothetical protein
MAKTDLTAINAKTISVDGVPVPGSQFPVGPFTSLDQIDADIVLALNGMPLFGVLPAGAVYTNLDNLNVFSGISVAEIIRFGVQSGDSPAPRPSERVTIAGDRRVTEDGNIRIEE